MVKYILNIQSKKNKKRKFKKIINDNPFNILKELSINKMFDIFKQKENKNNYFYKNCMFTCTRCKNRRNLY